VAVQSVKEDMGNLLVKVKFSFTSKYTAVFHVVFESRPILIVKGLKYMIYDFLHHSGAVGGSEWHDYRCVEPISHFEC